MTVSLQKGEIWTQKQTNARKEGNVKRHKEKTATYKPRNAWGYRKLGEKAAEILIWYLQRENVPANTASSDFWPPEPCDNPFLLF